MVAAKKSKHKTKQICPGCEKPKTLSYLGKSKKTKGKLICRTCNRNETLLTGKCSGCGGEDKQLIYPKEPGSTERVCHICGKSKHNNQKLKRCPCNKCGEKKILKVYWPGNKKKGKVCSWCYEVIKYTRKCPFCRKKMLCKFKKGKTFCCYTCSKK